jgi:hypothetical protein
MQRLQPDVSADLDVTVLFTARPLALALARAGAAMIC